MNFNEKLINLRKSKGLSQEELGNELKVSRQTISKWESCQSYPDFQRLVLLSDYFGLTLDELVRDLSLIHICKRTQDSVLANDIYHQLTNEGLKVFYAAITLEDKLGKEYEPYIFSALHTAKVMLVLGTKPEYLSAVWVRNEWSRFLKIMKKDHSRLLIPCYRDMDPYELPDEFAHLQAQDMSKIGFITDLIRGIKKVVDTDFCEDWWLRSDGQYDSSSYYYSAEEEYMYMYVRDYVDDDGRVIDVDGKRYYYVSGVCPAIWLDLSTLGD